MQLHRQWTCLAGRWGRSWDRGRGRHHCVLQHFFVNLPPWSGQVRSGRPENRKERPGTRHIPPHLLHGLSLGAVLYRPLEPLAPGTTCCGHDGQGVLLAEGRQGVQSGVSERGECAPIAGGPPGTEKQHSRLIC